MQAAQPAPADLSALQALGGPAVVGDSTAGGQPATWTKPAAAAGVGGVRKLVAVASCKGGVGKSTAAVNLAYSLAARGLAVGIVDLDVHGPSLPTMVKPDAPLQLEGEALLPLTSRGVKLMSMGYLNPGAMPLRGVKVTPIVQQLVGRTVWGELDYLVIDLPPGTGDVQLTLAQDFSVDAAVLVTTPQRLSFVDVVKGVEMFDKVGIPTVAVLENMAGLEMTEMRDAAEALIAKHRLADAAAAELRALIAAPQRLFGESHIPALKAMWGIQSSFSLPLLPSLASTADLGVPAVLVEPRGEAAAAFAELAAAVEREVEALAGRVLPALMYSEEEGAVLVQLPERPTQRVSPLELRRLCRSPSNDVSALSPRLRPLELLPMGNYAVSVLWSDGHQSLIPYASFVEDWQ